MLNVLPQVILEEKSISEENQHRDCKFSILKDK